MTRSFSHELNAFDAAFPEHDCGPDCGYPDGFAILIRDDVNVPGTMESNMFAHHVSPHDIVTSLISVIDDLIHKRAPEGTPRAVVWAQGRDLIRGALENQAPPPEVSAEITSLMQQWSDEAEK